MQYWYEGWRRNLNWRLRRWFLDKYSVQNWGEVEEEMWPPRILLQIETIWEFSERRFHSELKVRNGEDLGHKLSWMERQERSCSER